MAKKVQWLSGPIGEVPVDWQVNPKSFPPKMREQLGDPFFGDVWNFVRASETHKNKTTLKIRTVFDWDSKFYGGNTIREGTVDSDFVVEYCPPVETKNRPIMDSGVVATAGCLGEVAVLYIAAIFVAIAVPFIIGLMLGL